jgi:eukaryotic-like serine/threonine-protein kinase
LRGRVFTGIGGGIAYDTLPARYVSPARIASGGMGDVYRATDSVLGRAVAVKVLAERHARNEDVRERFKREALAAAQLSGHRHVVTVFDVGEHAGRPFIVMELLEGGSVHDRLRTGAVPSGRALDWLEETAGALDAAHAHGIVHRDVKPANLLLNQADSVHVSDFGIASAAGHDTLTLPGTVLGTTGYLSPEQARGEPATPASDRYALGVVAFELLTGRRPFAADTPVTEAFAHLNADVPSAERLQPSLPAGVDAVLARALAKDPDERPASSRELVAELRDAFAADAAPTLVVAPPAPPAPPAHPSRRTYDRRRRPLLYASAALVVLVLGLAGAALITALSDDPERSAAGGNAGTTAARQTSEITTTTEPPPPAPPPAPEPPPPAPPPPPPPSSGADLNDDGFALMQAGDFQGALPLLEQAVATLAGSGSLAEAYASYNLAFTRFALGSCDGVEALLDRSEAVQGERKEIDRVRRDVERACVDGRGGGGDKDKDKDED